MKGRFRLIQVGYRGGNYYAVDTVTGQRESLRTKNKFEAQQLLSAKNESFRQPAMNRQMGKIYLANADPNIATRTWQTALDTIIDR